MRSLLIHFCHILACISGALIAVAAQAATLDLLVQDSHGQPLAHAVVLLPGTIAAAPADIAVMDQIDKRFVPEVLVVQQGQQVIFPNSDNIRHHVYSFSPAKPFEIKLYAGVPEAPLLFDTAGVVVLGCNIHDTMVGYIVVADTPNTGLTDATGRTRVTVTELPQTLRIWHPYLAATSQQPVTIPLPQPGADGVTVITLQVTAPAPVTPTATFGNRFKKPHGQ